MAIERRSGRTYYYTTERVGSTVIRRYRGAGELAVAMNHLDMIFRQDKTQDEWEARYHRDRHRRRNARFRKWLDKIGETVAEALRGAGWHQHNREWRKKRGTIMGTLGKAPTAEQARATWQAGELSAMAGALDPATAEKAKKGDTSVVAEVDAFLGNPAAVAFWGDLGRRLLQRWIETYAGDCLTTRRAVWKFASDLRSGLAGPNPTALDYLLAERVVIGWVFLHWCEAQYARQLTKLSWKESEFHTKRIEMANRNLMSAARTLAKVKKSKLPDVLALVNVNPPSIGPV